MLACVFKPLGNNQVEFIIARFNLLHGIWHLKRLIADTVTEEVVLTDQVRRLPIQNAAEWANEIHKIPKERRTDAAERIQSRGFDIKNEAQKLEKFYLELVGKEHEEG